MKKIHGTGSALRRLLRGKGFYIALSCSLAAVGGAAWLGLHSAIDKLDQPDPSPNDIRQESSTPNSWSVPQKDTPADVNKPGVPANPSSSPEEEAPTTQSFLLPVAGDVLNPFSGDQVVKSKTLDDWMMHTGVDILAGVATPVKAAGNGTVLAVQNDALWGTAVTIQHGNGIVSYYANLKSAVNVTVGQEVKLGDVIGAVGETCEIERAEESHLHFGMKQNGTWVDPMSLCE